ncbi:unnamed protein product [Ambrosiozyma monospora]|uniref:Unnamed protein product n=1 Tax=Ambrosiozyma monospora TaxID=43982 RepID=A0ACB5T0Y1_AMBMO|nr:unnamed protein product [Ambrosiozyma monospora]
MIDPRWYKDAWLRTRAPSSLQYLLRLLFKKVTAELVYREGIVIHRFNGTTLSTSKYDDFISYLEAFPPEYFNLVICPFREMVTSSTNFFKRSINIANDITCNNDISVYRSLNARVLFPKVARLVLRTGPCAEYAFFDKFTNVANIEFEVCDGRSPNELQELMTNLTPLLSKNNGETIRVDVQLASYTALVYEPELYAKVMNLLRNAHVSTEIKIGSKTCIYGYHISSSCENLRELSFDQAVLDQNIDYTRLTTVAELLNKCHSLRKLKFTSRIHYLPTDCLYLKLASLEELEIGKFPFDVGECPNLKKLIFSSSKASDYGSTLKYLQNSGVTELVIKEINQYLNEEELQKKRWKLP